jgi:hypothetical protein
VLGAVAAFFLIYTIPAASIGGIPGMLALNQSVQAVRAAPIASVILAAVFFAVWYFAVPVGLPYLLIHVSPAIWSFASAGARAVALAYLAFPFSRQYDDVAFRGYL